jgi:hypothetical protein
MSVISAISDEYKDKQTKNKKKSENTVFKINPKSKHPKTDELRWMLASNPDTFKVPEFFQPGTLEYDHHTYPFLPTSTDPNYCGNRLTSTKKPKVVEVSKIPEPELRDAETGEVIKFSTSQWSTKEGRVNLDPISIVERGIYI